ncbi:hypothetical protein PanWU01x14_013700 [Parasponia andersonii]|uniref:Uncharacterized protein n=1 Tax=Parasponia andersonii TaxID=3476 RepID=A0A2P5E136_PARAD|nr:hypothetical protein PanWU01x14_013700 [Parasponia andersonii]
MQSAIFYTETGSKEFSYEITTCKSPLKRQQIQLSFIAQSTAMLAANAFPSVMSVNESFPVLMKRISLEVLRATIYLMRKQIQTC